tara:strand:- start:681 stop:1091 length:411 start_codon:yes stop_codon:yes gene_type:complete
MTRDDKKTKKSLSNRDINNICKLLVCWQGKLTWARLVNAIHDDLGIKITRQTLSDYFAIKNEYSLKKAELRGASNTSRIPESAPITHLQNKVYKLQQENKMLERTKIKQLAMIERILENAREIPNLDISMLLKPRD